MLALDFVKMHGVQNSFIIINDLGDFVSNSFSLSVDSTDFCNFVTIICSKNARGLAADGLVLLSTSSSSDFKMVVYNADGSEALMCGNAVRCLAKYVLDVGLTSSKEVDFETKNRVVSTTVLDYSDYKAVVKVDMGEALFHSEDFPSIKQADLGFFHLDQYKYFCVAMPNPHAVTFVEDFNFDYHAVADKVQNSGFFPNGVNVEFVKKEIDGLVVRVVERGVGETMACGTGACASVVAYANESQDDEKFETISTRVSLLGGDLSIKYKPSRDLAIESKVNSVWMTGECEMVLKGTYCFN